MLVKDADGVELMVSDDVCFAPGNGLLLVRGELRDRCEDLVGERWVKAVVEGCSEELAQRHRDGKSLPPNLGGWFLGRLMDMACVDRFKGRSGRGRRLGPRVLRAGF